MIIECLSREHRNIERLLAVLEHELEVFDRGDHPDLRLFARLSAISKCIRSCTIILRKTWFLPGELPIRMRLQRSVTSHLSTKKEPIVCAASLKQWTVSSPIVKSFGKMSITSFAAVTS